MKKIGIDCRLIGRTGVGTYIKNLVYYLEKIAPRDWIFKLYLMKDDFNIFKVTNPNFQKVLANYRWHSFEEQAQFYLKLKKDNLDLVHFTYFTYPFLYRKNFVATIHDLTPILFKTGRASTKNQLIYQIKHALFRFVLSSEIKNSIRIITPCETVKNQIIDHYGLHYKNKIEPIYEGVNYELINQKENEQLHKEYKQDFLLYVGNFYPHKNVESLIRAFAKVKTDTKLILVGPDDFFSRRVIQLINQLDQDGRIELYRNPTLRDLVFFYKNAKALVNPSFSEGFGLPLVEAAYFDCPVIASDIKVFQEILGENYVGFNPYDIDDIAAKIDDLLKDKPKFDYQDIRKKYSFEKMAKETLELYQRTF